MGRFRTESSCNELQQTLVEDKERNPGRESTSEKDRERFRPRRISAY